MRVQRAIAAPLRQSARPCCSGSNGCSIPPGSRRPAADRELARASTGTSSARRAGSSSRCSPPGSASRCWTRTIPVFIGRVVTLVSTDPPETLFATPARGSSRWMALVSAGRCGPAALLAAGADHQPDHRSRRHQPDPLAEPLACGAPELDVLPERFRRPDRQPRDADRPGAARERRRGDQRRLVHPRLRHDGGRAPDGARDWRLALPIALLVRGLCGCCCATSCRGCATRSRPMSEVRSALTGRVVDSYTNILTVKLFARARDEDAFVRDCGRRAHGRPFAAQHRA